MDRPTRPGVFRSAGGVVALLLLAAGCGGPSGGISPDAKGGSSSGLLGGILSVWDNICCNPLFGPARAQARPGEIPDLALSPEKQQRIGVRTEEVVVAPMRRTVRAVGRVEADERNVATVTLKTEAWIEHLHADHVGKPVRKGEPVADYYSPEIVTYQQEFLYLLESSPYWNRMMVEYSTGDRYAPAARVSGALRDPILQKTRDRLQFWGLTEEQIRKVEEDRRPIRTFTVDSPVSGYVVEKPVVRGSRVAPGDKIVDIADLSTVWVLADVYASDLPYVKVGQNARLSIRHVPDKEFPARIDYVYPALSGATRTTKVRFVLPNPGTLLKPKMFADVSIAVDLGRRLSVPEEAIIDTGVAQVVYVAKGEGHFEPRRIVTGVRADGRAEVVSGLKAGEKVAASGAFLIDSEAKLKGVAH